MQTLSPWTFTPCTAALGVSRPEADAGTASATLPPSPLNAGPDGGIHPLALLPFLDELGSHAVRSLGAGANGMATIELRLDWLGIAAPGPIAGSARAIGGRGGARFAAAQAHDSRGAVIAAAQLWFATGAFPGQPASDGPRGLDPTPEQHWGDGPFEALLGLERVRGGAHLQPAPAAVGWTGLPAVHGGVVGVLLAAAAEEALRTHVGLATAPALRLAGLTVRYLRAVPARGAAASADIGKSGRRSGHVRSRCTTAAGGPVLAEADALFLA
jgi:acyl-coenzyme A thioesterase PaaI-like protein